MLSSRSHCYRLHRHVETWSWIVFGLVFQSHVSNISHFYPLMASIRLIFIFITLALHNIIVYYTMLYTILLIDGICCTFNGAKYNDTELDIISK